MVYRKGERPVEKKVVDYSPDHPVASGIADGDHWMDAWLGQMCTPWETITRKTGISRERIGELNDDAEPTRAELEKERKSVGEGTSESVSVDTRGCRNSEKKK